MFKLLPRRIGLTLMGLFLILSAAIAQTPTYKNGARMGEIKVKFKSEVVSTLSRAAKSGRASRFGIATLDAAFTKVQGQGFRRLFPSTPANEAKLHRHGLDQWFVIEIRPDMDPLTAVTEFKKLQEVAIAEVDHQKILAPYQVQTYQPSVTTQATLPFNDPLLKDQWHYNNTKQSGFGDADINLFEAWKLQTGSPSVIVSIHDEGVDVEHDDLKDNLWINQDERTGRAGFDDDGNGYVDDIHGFNFENNTGDIDPQYHGTHVAGTIAAINNNGIGVGGVAGGDGSGNGVRIMSLQIIGSSRIENSFIYAADNGAVISQNSWGYTSPYFFDESVKEAIKYFIAEAGNYPGSPMKGGLVIFAAGNSGSDSEWYPGYFEGTFAVASIGPEWKRASYTNFGAWIEVAAPGGDQDYGSRSGVLSTIPNNQYAYLQGTSMACPHVTGIAALALSNRNRQLSNTDLWNKLITGVVNIDKFNPGFEGKLGTGAVDASLAVKNDLGIAPNRITDLTLKGISQEFGTFEWTVPVDNDDFKPYTFKVYYHTEPLTRNNLAQAQLMTIRNDSSAGKKIGIEINGLLGLTTYHIGVVALDRWGNASDLSNIISATTNEGPSIAVDEESALLEYTIQISEDVKGTQPITILNNGSGILRWNYFVRHSSAELSFNSAGIRYPKVGRPDNTINLRRRSVNVKKQVKGNSVTPLAFTPVEKSLSTFPTNIVGETDTTLTNSAAGRFVVTEPEGFNLTQVRMYLKHDPAKGPVVVEIYKGTAPVKKNLLLAQEYSNWSNEETTAFINLNEQLFFEKGSTFWVVFHFPSGNLFPLGIGFESAATDSKNSQISFDLGATWIPLEDALNSKDFAYVMTAASYNATLGNYVTLEPGSGEIAGNGSSPVDVTADASELINGVYHANLVLTSNDPKKQELRIPVTVNVEGHKPNLKPIDIVDFGSVFKGSSGVIDITLENIGFGNFSNLQFEFSNPEFSFKTYAPWQIKAREQVTVPIKFSPTAAGNSNGVLTVTNGEQTYEIALFGVGTETTKINVAPAVVQKNNVTIGDEVTATFQVKNEGAYPLKYFVPQFDTKGISENWPTPYHKYGYTLRSNYASEANPIPYEFNSIAGTGKDIADEFADNYSYYSVELGFEFPFYGEKMNKLFIARGGFTTFDNSVRPINVPRLGDSYSPKGYISPIGGFLSYLVQGRIYYKQEADRIIVQYEKVWDGFSVGEELTVQMVLFANGDIRFYYDNVTYTETNLSYLSILVENLAQNDGILINNYENPTSIYSGLVLGLDYPGPDIIKSVTNGSGILMPGSTANVDVTLETTSVSEGVVKRYVSFISNDPNQPGVNTLIQMNVTDGGFSVPLVSTDSIDFGKVFQGATVKSEFLIRNPGSAKVQISSVSVSPAAFTLLPAQPATIIQPGLYNKYDVVLKTTNLGNFTGWIIFTYADLSKDSIYVHGEVGVPPAITIDLSPVTETIAYKEKKALPITISNPGLADLEFTAAGEQWLTFDKTANPQSGQPGSTYAWKRYNDGGNYQWLDIRRTGTHLPLITDIFNPDEYWSKLDLPFPISVYGKDYTSFHIGQNGIISFDENPRTVMFFPGDIPTNTPGTMIMPYWAFGGFSDMFWPTEDVGIFYKFEEDRIIITWSFIINNFGGMGDPVSAQIQFFKNGTIKYQLKVEEEGLDLTSQSSVIGIQENETNGVEISAFSPVPHGKGLVYILMPVEKYVVKPGETLNGFINLDATNIYGGTYEGSLKFNSNVPGMESFTKPVSLTVEGIGVYSYADTVKLGSTMVALDPFGMPKSISKEGTISNTGSAPFEITYAQMTDGTQGLTMQIWAFVDGWFGPEWRWADISELYSPWATPAVFTINPGESIRVRAVFAPTFGGDFQDVVQLTTSLGLKEVVLTGSAVEPPVLAISANPVILSMNAPDEVIQVNIPFDNLAGASDLTYETSIDFARAGTSGYPQGKVSSNANLRFVEANVPPSVQTLGTYNRTLTHTDKKTPDTYVGIGLTGAFKVATRYNAGPEGFNLTHLETWFRREALTSGIVTAEVRAGGTSIANAKLLATGEIAINGTGSDAIGSWNVIKLNTAAGIFPNEDFYIIFSYPLGIEFPQGTITNTDKVAGRYYYLNEGVWNDLQELGDFSNMGWLTLAGEEVAGVTAWLSLEGPQTGTLIPGDTSSLKLKVQGRFAEQGDQSALVVLRSNDPNRNIVRIPVKLHLNEAPAFTYPKIEYVVAEQDSIKIQVDVADAENHAFTLTKKSAGNFVKHTFDAGLLTIMVKPVFGDAGSKEIVFEAIDENGAKGTLTIPVEVLKTNRAPVFSASEPTLEFTQSGPMATHNLSDFFTDPDNDQLTFTVASSNPEVLNVFASAAQFITKPGTHGTANLTFEVKDGKGGVTLKTVPVNVGIVLAVENPGAKSISVYPNPAKTKTKVQLDNNWTGLVDCNITDGTGRIVLTQEFNASASKDLSINLTNINPGLYIIKVYNAERSETLKLIVE